MYFLSLGILSHFPPTNYYPLSLIYTYFKIGTTLDHIFLIFWYQFALFDMLDLKV
jgi:hypothetical protein